jgi:cytochrome c oxidase subunit II
MFSFIKNSFFCSLDAPTAWAFGFQEPATPVMEGIDNFHSDLLFFLVVICIFVFTLLFYEIYNFGMKSDEKRELVHFSEHAGLETVWTILPTLILLIIVFPSLALLFATEDYIKKPYSTYHIIGRQWYWTYEYRDSYLIDPEVKEYRYDSYMVPTNELRNGELRNLKVDKGLIVPAYVPLRLLITSSDVIHSWALPSAGVKVDACPGRLNQIFVTFKRTGRFYGQCSEICGVNHALMPIEVTVLAPEDYVSEMKRIFAMLKKGVDIQRYS